MESITIRLWIIGALSIPIGIFLGNSVVYVFNKIPEKWLCDYNEIPNEEKFIPGRQRLNSNPWKYAFSAAFVGLTLFLCQKDIVQGLNMLIQLWLLLIIAISDKKYMIIPDQFVIFLALSAIGSSKKFVNIDEMIYGMFVGAGIMLLIAVIGKLITRKEALGFGDVKLMAAIGLIAGFHGVIIILMGASIISSVVFGYKILKKQLKLNDMAALGPYLAGAAGVYLIATI